MKLFFSILIACLGVVLTWAQAVQPILSGGWVWDLTHAEGLAYNTGILVVAVVGIVASQGVAIPQWLKSAIFDIEWFVEWVRPSIEKAATKVARALVMLFALVMFCTVLLCVGCAGTPCGDLENGIKAAKQGEVIAGVVCECISVDPTAAAICEVAAEGSVISVNAAEDIYAAFCSQPDGGTDATPTDSGMTLAQTKLSTRPQFDQYFAAHGAKKASR